MAKILLVSTFYRPIESIATNRIYAFAKYLDEMGHKITVLTVDGKKEYEGSSNIKIIRVSDHFCIRKADTDKKEKKNSSLFKMYLQFNFNEYFS